MRVLLLLLLSGVAVAADKPAPKRTALHVRSVDLAQRRVVVEITHGQKKAPQANFFTFVDERGRRFVAQAARCAEPAEDVRSCELELPAGYERHKLKTLSMHIGSLKGREISAPEDELDAPAAPPPDGGVSPSTN
jgi:hypothetical protein